MTYNPSFNGTNATGTASGGASSYPNGTSGQVAVASAISVNTSGNFVLTNVTDESLAESWVGLTSQAVPFLATGQASTDGRVKDIPSSLGFSVGDPLWVGTTPGSLTKVKPDLAVSGWSSGMWVLFVGVVVKNEFDSSKQDIQLSRQIIGRL